MLNKKSIPYLNREQIRENSKKLKNTVETKYTYKKLGKGSKYYFKVRVYKQVDNNIYYSAFTPVKSVKYK